MTQLPDPTHAEPAPQHMPVMPVMSVVPGMPGGLQQPPGGVPLMMWFVLAIITIIVTAIPPTLIAWSSLKQSQENKVKVQEATQKTAEVHDLVNSRMSELLELTRKESEARGVLAQKQRQNAETQPSEDK